MTRARAVGHTLALALLLLAVLPARPAAACGGLYRADGVELVVEEAGCRSAGGAAEGVAGLRVTAAAVFEEPGGAQAILARFAAVSRYPEIRYWSSTRGRWRPLVVAAHPLAGAEGPRRADDFRVDELAEGSGVHFFQRENTPAGEVIYRLSIEALGPDALVATAANANTVRVFGLPLFRPGEYRFRYAFRRIGGQSWDYRGELAVAGDGLPVPGDRGASFATRMAAVSLHLLGRRPTAPPVRVR